MQFIDGFQSTLFLEILATVDFIRWKHRGASLDDVMEAIADWSVRKSVTFPDKYVEIAYGRLLKQQEEIGFELEGV